MAFWGAAIPAAASVVGSVFGKKNKPLGQRDIDDAYRRGSQPFKFNANADDPALKLQNLRAGNMYRSNRGKAVNEVHRSGLGGSSIALGSLQGVDSDYARQLEGIGYENLEGQRREQLTQWQSNMDYMRQLQKMRLEAMAGANAADASARSGAVAGLGQVAGALYANKTPGSVSKYRYTDPNQPWLGGY